MKTEYLIFILISAFLHSFYNFLMRRSKGSLSFLTLIFIVASILALITSVSIGDFSTVKILNIAFIFCASLFYVLYQVFVSKSYELGDISACYPLTLLSPIFVPVWAYLFLSERISFIAFMGILITILGAITAKLNSFNMDEIKKVFRFHTDYKSARFALLASLMYSFGATFDKSKINTFDLPVYISLLISLMTINMIIFSLLTKEFKLKYAKNHLSSILLGGLIVYLSFLFFRLALQHVYVSIAIPIRLTSVIFALILGGFALKEKIILSRIIGISFIVLGIIVINLGI